MTSTFLARSAAIVGLVGVSLFGLVTAASAATLTTATATSSSEIGITGTNATPITIAATSVTGAPANMFNIDLPSGWSFVTDSTGCTNVTLTGFSGSPNCVVVNFSATDGFISVQLQSGTFTAGQALSVTFAANTINVAGTRNFTVTLANSQAGGAAVDSGTATLAGGTPAPAPAPAPSDNTTAARLATTGAAGELVIASATLLLLAGGALLFGTRQRARHSR